MTRRGRRTGSPQLDLAEAEARVRRALEEEPHVDLNRFLLAYGEAFRPVHGPDDVDEAPKRWCYRNAYRLARQRPGLRYYEGVSLAPGWDGFPSNHAWCVDQAGAVLDPTATWADPGKELRDCYFGVEIPLDLAAPHVEGTERGHAGCFATARARSTH